MERRPVDRILDSVGDPQLVEVLADLPGSDLTTLLLEVMARRSSRLTAADVMRQRASDRFVEPGEVDLGALHATEADLLGALPEDFATLVLSPLAPLGIHGAVGRVHQNNVVSTTRRTDVAADPTTGLAIEAALRRRDLIRLGSSSDRAVKLVSIQRVVRAQTFDGPMSFSHFSLLGLVTAGLDIGSHRFEAASLVEHASVLARSLLTAGADRLEVRIADWSDGDLGSVLGSVSSELGDDPVEVVDDSARRRGRGYYRQGAFEIVATVGGNTFSAADGGLVDWTQQLVGSRKERLMISGIGIDRVALSRTSPSASSGDDTDGSSR